MKRIDKILDNYYSRLRAVVDRWAKADVVVDREYRSEFDALGNEAKQAILADLLALPELQGSKPEFVAMYLFGNPNTEPHMLCEKCHNDEFDCHCAGNSYVAISEVRQALTDYFEGVEK